jgi:hypothetical protein
MDEHVHITSDDIAPRRRARVRGEASRDMDTLGASDWSRHATPASVLALQRLAGNRAVSEAIKQGRVSSPRAVQRSKCGGDCGSSCCGGPAAEQDVSLHEQVPTGGNSMSALVARKLDPNERGGTHPDRLSTPPSVGMNYNFAKDPVAVQNTLEVSDPSDAAELEADSIAGRLFPPVGGTSSTPVARIEDSSLLRDQGGTGSARREGAADGGTTCTDCAGASLPAVTAASGSPLSDRSRTEMQNAFNTDLSSVRIHADSNSAKLARSLRADAFTYGDDIFFDHGKYDPDSQSGKRLLAHELTHTVQQRDTLARLSRQGEGRTALQCVNANLANMGIAAWLITIVGGTCGLIGALAGSPTGPGAAGTAAAGAVLCIAGLTGLSVGMVTRVIYECIKNPEVQVGLPGTLADVTSPPGNDTQNAGATEAAA